MLRRKAIVAVSFCLLTIFRLGFSEITTSESFKRIAENIIKENIKQTILKTFDPMSAIIAADLIEQVINGMDKTEITKSAIDVSYTLTYLYAIKPKIESLLEKYPEIYKQAKNIGYDKKQLIGYSCLYFYYSEKIKYNYLISPEINRLSKQKAFISSLRAATGEKWVALISKELIKKRREEGMYIYDVRLNEFIRFSTKSLIIYPDSAKIRISQALKNLIEQYHGNERKKIQTIVGESDRVINVYSITQNVFNLYLKKYLTVITDTTSFETDILYAVKNIYNQQYFDREELVENIFQMVAMTLEEFLNQGLRNKTGFQYTVSLAGTIYPEQAFSDSARLDFTVLDQIRYQKNFKSGSYFLYIGGFLDPILKSTVYKKGTKLYQAGAGCQFRNIFITVNAGIPYPEFKPKDITTGISMGYEIPLSQLIKK